MTLDCRHLVQAQLGHSAGSPDVGSGVGHMDDTLTASSRQVTSIREERLFSDPEKILALSETTYSIVLQPFRVV